jgi:hypothetical protein
MAGFGGFLERNGVAVAVRRRTETLLPSSKLPPFGSIHRGRRIDQVTFEMCFPVTQTTIIPPLGFFFESRSLNLTLAFAEAFFFWEAMCFWGCDVFG